MNKRQLIPVIVASLLASATTASAQVNWRQVQEEAEKRESSPVAKGSQAIVESAVTKLLAELAQLNEKLGKQTDGKGKIANVLVQSFGDSKNRFFDSLGNAMVAQKAEGKKGAQALEQVIAAYNAFLGDAEVIFTAVARFKETSDSMVAQNDGLAKELAALVPALYVEMSLNDMTLKNAVEAARNWKNFPRNANSDEVTQNDYYAKQRRLIDTVRKSVLNCAAVAINLKTRAAAMSSPGHVELLQKLGGVNSKMIKALLESKKVGAVDPGLKPLISAWDKLATRAFKEVKKSADTLKRAARPVHEESIFGGLSEFSGYKYHGLEKAVDAANKDFDTAIHKALGRIPN